MKKLITNHVHEYGGQRITGVATLHFDQDGISQELEDNDAEKLANISKSLSIFEYEKLNDEAEITANKKAEEEEAAEAARIAVEKIEADQKQAEEAERVRLEEVARLEVKSEEDEIAVENQEKEGERVDSEIEDNEDRFTKEEWAEQLNSIAMDKIKELLVETEGIEETIETLARFTRKDGKKNLIDFAAPLLAEHA